MAKAAADCGPAGAECVISASEVSAAVDRLAAILQPEIDAGDCVLLTVMLGGMIPAAWLATRLNGDFTLDYCHVTRYAGGETGGQPRWLQPPGAELRDRCVLIIDDIYDEGITMEYVEHACRERGARRIVTCALVAKQHERAGGRRPPDHVGLHVPDRYVFGAGMDLRNRWRHLAGIWAMAENPGD